MQTLKFEGLEDEYLLADLGSLPDDEYYYEEEQPEILTYPIEEMDINIPDRIAVVGGAETGKSTVARHLIRLFQSTNKIVATYWFGSHAHYESYLPEGRRELTVNKPKINKLRKVMARFFKPQGLFSLLIFDDINLEKVRGGKDERWWNELFTQSRHENLILIICTHNTHMMHPTARNSTKRWIITETNVRMVDNLFLQSKRYGNKSQFRDLMLKVQQGEPLMMDLSPGNRGEELHRLIVSKLEAEDM